MSTRKIITHLCSSLLLGLAFFFVLNLSTAYASAGFVASPSTITQYSTGNSITLTGTNAAWSAGTPGSPTFTVSGGTGSSITAQTVTSQTGATITLSAGSTAGSLTVTDPSTGSTTNITVAADTTAPQVTLTAPAAGTNLLNTVTLTAVTTQSNNVPVTGIQFAIDGVNVGAAGSGSSYSLTYNTLSLSDGTHTISAAARDAAANYATSSVTVTVGNGCASVMSTVGNVIYTTKCGVTTTSINPYVSVTSPSVSTTTSATTTSAMSTSTPVITSTTTASTTPSTSAGCMSGNLFNILTGAHCLGVSSSTSPESSMNTVPAMSVPASSFTTALTVGNFGDEVKNLQEYLNQHGFTIAATGPGSAGSETTYFGALTKDALIKFQESSGITPASGYFGPITIAYVNSH
jgi:hypothetical protein